MKRKQGISLIVLVITIIVIVILATAVILSIANNNPIGNAKEATFKSDIKTIEEELELLKASNYAKNNGVNYNDPETNAQITISDLTSASGKYQDKLVVSDGELKYKASKLTEEEIKWANEIGLTFSPYILKNVENGITISEDGTLTVDDVEFENSLKEIGTDIEIPEGVTSIGEHFGFSNTSLTSVKLPNTLTYIGTVAFTNCKSLKSITMPNVRYLGEDVFRGCTSLKSVTMPNLENLNVPDTFEDCTSLESVVMPNVEIINVKSFSGCKSLKTITLPSKLKNISGDAFERCDNLLEIKILGKEYESIESFKYFTDIYFWDDLNESCEIKVKYDSVKTLLEEAGCTLNITVVPDLI